MNKLDIDFLTDNYDLTYRTNALAREQRIKRACSHFRGMYKRLKFGEVQVGDSNLSMMDVNNLNLEKLMKTLFSGGLEIDSLKKTVGMAIMKESDDHREKGLEDIIAITGLWMDIDYDIVQQNIPDDVFEALAIIDEIPLTPTIVNDLGNSLHCFWAFESVLEFKTRLDRLLAIDLLLKFQKYVHGAAEGLGYNIFYTADLMHETRLAGSFNHYYYPPKIVRTLFNESDNKYSIQMLQKWLNIFDEEQEYNNEELEF
jgi:hypothetical protein